MIAYLKVIDNVVLIARRRLIQHYVLAGLIDHPFVTRNLIELHTRRDFSLTDFLTQNLKFSENALNTVNAC
jgi:hypothetical protein